MELQKFILYIYITSECKFETIALIKYIFFSTLYLNVK